MRLSLIDYFVIAATFLSAILAGATLDRLVVQMPAWRDVGALGWAAYSLHADLKNGIFFYPVLAIGSTLASIAAAIAIYLRRTKSYASWFMYLAALFGVAGLLSTTQAAPFMFSLKNIAADPAAIQNAFDGFDRWTQIRGAVQILCFVANFCALIFVLHRR